MISAFGVDHGGPVSKAEDHRKRGAALTATGVGAGVVATRHNAIANAVNTRHQRKTDAKIHSVRSAFGADDAGRPTTDPRRAMPRDAAGRTVYQGVRQRAAVRNEAKRLVRNKHRTLAELRVTRNKVPMGGSARSKLLLGSTAVAIPATWIGSRQMVNKAVKRRDVDAAMVGAAVGAGGYQYSGYALKPLDRRAERKIAADDGLRQKARAYRTAAKLPRNAKAGDPAWHSYFRNYPKDLPGGRLKRTLAVTHTGRSGVAATVAAGAAGAGLAAHASQTLRRRKK